MGCAVSDAVEITGVASVGDGDTIEIHGTRIRLHGIDAPESRQLCRRSTGQNWRCGQQAALALADRIGRAPVTCRHTGTDQYDRMVAVCSQGAKNLNAWMVSNGWAVAYRHYSIDQVEAEEQAKAAARNIWSGPFVIPWNQRRGVRLDQVTAAADRPDGRDIKGNISRKGKRIYHVPGNRWYGPTNINAAKGER